MLENDSSPLDGQQENTRAHHTPDVPQQELSSLSLARAQFRKPQDERLFFPILGYIVFRNLYVCEVRQTFCRYSYF
jgi:hypothetical protein